MATTIEEPASRAAVGPHPLVMPLAPDWHLLAWIDNYLLAKGWTYCEAGWTPPENNPELLRAIQERHSFGHYNRSTAIGAQVEWDEWMMRHNDKDHRHE